MIRLTLSYNQQSLLFNSLSGDTDFLTLVPVPFGDLVKRHSDSLPDLHRLFIAPLVALVEFLLKHGHLFFGFAHTFAGNHFLVINLLLPQSNLGNRSW